MIDSTASQTGLLSLNATVAALATEASTLKSHADTLIEEMAFFNH